MIQNFPKIPLKASPKKEVSRQTGDLDLEESLSIRELARLTARDRSVLNIMEEGLQTHSDTITAIIEDPEGSVWSSGRCRCSLKVMGTANGNENDKESLR